MDRIAVLIPCFNEGQTIRKVVTDFEEVVKLDNDYIRNFSLPLDIKIIAKTFFTVLSRKGSK